MKLFCNYLFKFLQNRESTFIKKPRINPGPLKSKLKLKFIERRSNNFAAHQYF